MTHGNEKQADEVEAWTESAFSRHRRKLASSFTCVNSFKPCLSSYSGRKHIAARSAMACISTYRRSRATNNRARYTSDRPVNGVELRLLLACPSTYAMARNICGHERNVSVPRQGTRYMKFRRAQIAIEIEGS